MISNDPGQLSMLAKFEPSTPVVLFIGEFNYLAMAYDADTYVRSLDEKHFHQSLYDWLAMGGVGGLLPLSSIDSIVDSNLDFFDMLNVGTGIITTEAASSILSSVQLVKDFAINHYSVTLNYLQAIYILQVCSVYLDKVSSLGRGPHDYHLMIRVPLLRLVF